MYLSSSVAGLSNFRVYNFPNFFKSDLSRPKASCCAWAIVSQAYYEPTKYHWTFRENKLKNSFMLEGKEQYPLI